MSACRAKDILNLAHALHARNATPRRRVRRSLIANLHGYEKHKETGMFVATAEACWLVDSGANVIVVPPGDPLIRAILGTNRKLNTAQGPVETAVVSVETPFGVLPGLASPGSPRLLPMGLFHDYDLFVDWRHKNRALVRCVQSGTALHVLDVVDGTPVCSPTIRLRGAEFKGQRCKTEQYGYYTAPTAGTESQKNSAVEQVVDYTEIPIPPKRRQCRRKRPGKRSRARYKRSREGGPFEQNVLTKTGLANSEHPKGQTQSTVVTRKRAGMPAEKSVQKPVGLEEMRHSSPTRETPTPGLVELKETCDGTQHGTRRGGHCPQPGATGPEHFRLDADDTQQEIEDVPSSPWDIGLQYSAWHGKPLQLESEAQLQPQSSTPPPSGEGKLFCTSSCSYVASKCTLPCAYIQRSRCKIYRSQRQAKRRETTMRLRKAVEAKQDVWDVMKLMDHKPSSSYVVRQRYHTVSYAEHILGGHFPYSKDCEVCRQCRTVKAALRRTHGLQDLNPDGRQVFLMDFHGPLPPSSGGHTYILIIRWIRKNNCQPFYAKAVKTRNTKRTITILQKARVEFGCSRLSFMIIGDREGAWGTEDGEATQMRDEYLERNNGICYCGIPNRKGSTGKVEAAVRVYTEVCRCNMRQSAFPWAWWYHVVNGSWINFNWVHCHMRLRFNKIQHMVPIGALGYTTLHKTVSPRWLQGRGAYVALLHVEPDTRFGCRVSYHDRLTNTHRKTSVDFEGCEFIPDTFAFEWERRGVKEKQLVSEKFVPKIPRDDERSYIPYDKWNAANETRDVTWLSATVMDKEAIFPLLHPRGQTPAGEPLDEGEDLVEEYRAIAAPHTDPPALRDDCDAASEAHSEYLEVEERQRVRDKTDRGRDRREDPEIPEPDMMMEDYVLSDTDEGDEPEKHSKREHSHDRYPDEPVPPLRLPKMQKPAYHRAIEGREYVSWEWVRCCHVPCSKWRKANKLHMRDTERKFKKTRETYPWTCDKLSLDNGCDAPQDEAWYDRPGEKTSVKSTPIVPIGRHDAKRPPGPPADGPAAAAAQVEDSSADSDDDEIITDPAIVDDINRCEKILEKHAMACIHGIDQAERFHEEWRARIKLGYDEMPTEPMLLAIQYDNPGSIDARVAHRGNVLIDGFPSRRSRRRNIRSQRRPHRGDTVELPVQRGCSAFLSKFTQKRNRGGKVGRKSAVISQALTAVTHTPEFRALHSECLDRASALKTLQRTQEYKDLQQEILSHNSEDRLEEILLEQAAPPAVIPPAPTIEGSITVEHELMNMAESEYDEKAGKLNRRVRQGRAAYSHQRDALDPDMPETGIELTQEEVHALVVRKCNKQERQSERGVQCQQDEVKRLLDFTAFSECYSFEYAKRTWPKATISGVCMLTSIKHSERKEAEQKYKGRSVLLGDNIKNMSGETVNPNAADVGMYGPVTTLQAARAVFARALIHDFQCQTCDLKSAYLQSVWPDEMHEDPPTSRVPPHFLVLTPDIIRLLPDELQAEARKCKRPVWRMKRCLYGHPLSGHVWIETFFRWLKRRGWKQLPDDPALFYRGNTWLCAYVDDLAVAGPDDELEKFWAEIRGKDGFEIGAHENLKDFLGIRVIRADTVDARVCEIDMSDYAKMTVEKYLELWGKDWKCSCGCKNGGDASKCTKCGRERGNKATATPDKLYKVYTPMDDDLRHDCETGTPINRVQKMVGMLLWLARCGRPDISYAVSRIGSRVSKWDDRANAALLRVVRYLNAHPKRGIVMTVSKKDRPSDLEAVVYTDANLPVDDKAQSGYCLVVESPNGSLVPIAWSSKKQPITADSVDHAEMVACHLGVRECITLGHALSLDCAILGSDIVTAIPERPLRIRVDNMCVVINGRKGVADACGARAKALKLRAGLLRDLVRMGLIRVEYVKTDENKSDMFTKALNLIKFQEAMRLMSLRDLKHSTPAKL